VNCSRVAAAKLAAAGRGRRSQRCRRPARPRRAPACFL